MKISVVTPSLNRAEFLAQTIESVLTQAGDFSIEYVVQDGGSEGDVIRVLKDWEARVAQGLRRCNDVQFRWASEPDTGMYDAISQAFKGTSGEIMAWINTDDFYLPKAFELVAQVFTNYPSVDWICGIPTMASRGGAIISCRDQNTIYNQELIKRGLYHRSNRRAGFNWIQQDCVFWRRRLWDKVGGFPSPVPALTGDYRLWQRFAEQSDLVKLKAALSCFRIHDGQLTATSGAYEREIGRVPRIPPAQILLSRAHTIWAASPRIRRAANTLASLCGRRVKGHGDANRRPLVGRWIEWNHDTASWELRAL